MSVRLVALVACTLAIPLAAPSLRAAPRKDYTVVVSAPNRPYTHVPVFAAVPGLPAGASVRVIDTRSKEELPAQVVPDDGGGGMVCWLIRGLAQGESRTYRVETSPRGMASPDGVKVEDRVPQGAVEIRIDDELFTRYWYKGAPKPYCYPIIGPTGAPVTRAYPMESVPGEPQDHPHHRSFWFTFGEVNGIDFWSEGERAGREVHREFEALAGGPVCGVVRAVSDWVGPDGRKVCEEVRELRIYRVPTGRLLDFDITIRATEGPVEFGDTKEGMMGFRVAASMQLAGGQGHIVNSAGDRDGDTWGKAAEWCDYYGPVSGETAGIAVLDHPGNLRHPTYWHVRDYGLFAANPFGLRHFTGDRTGAGRYTLPTGEGLTFRYRVFLHRGTTEEAQVAALFGEYSDPPVVEAR